MYWGGGARTIPWRWTWKISHREHLACLKSQEYSELLLVFLFRKSWKSVRRPIFCIKQPVTNFIGGKNLGQALGGGGGMTPGPSLGTATDVLLRSQSQMNCQHVSLCVV